MCAQSSLRVVVGDAPLTVFVAAMSDVLHAAPAPLLARLRDDAAFMLYELLGGVNLKV
jgi:hypothetical protein